MRLECAVEPRLGTGVSPGGVPRGRGPVRRHQEFPRKLLWSKKRSTSGFSYGVILKMTPLPYAPPCCVVPYRLPCASKTGLLNEYRPSLPPVKT